MAKVNVQAIKDYKDLYIPTGLYEVDVVDAVDGSTENGEYIDITFKVVDTIPGGQEIDSEEFIDAVAEQSIISYRLWVPGDGAEGWQVKAFNRTANGFMEYFGLDPMNEDEIVGDDFKGLTGGVKIAIEPMNKKDPDSKSVNRVKFPVAVL